MTVGWKLGVFVSSLFFPFPLIRESLNLPVSFSLCSALVFAVYYFVFFLLIHFFMLGLDCGRGMTARVSLCSLTFSYFSFC